MPGNSNQPWGLILPGRAATPSEGAAQTYQRVGPHGTQKTRTFDNGTCLTFGPQDLVDEFDLYKHPFSEQVILIDTAIRDCRAERIRYEGSGMASFREAQGEEVFPKDDPFNNFRCTQIPLDPVSVPKVQIDSGTYIQVPSVNATCCALRSVYSTQNKADLKGDAHSAYGADSRFGVTCKPPEEFSQRNRPESGDGAPAFKYNGERTYAKFDPESRDDRAKYDKNRLQRAPKHVRNELERQRLEKEREAEMIFDRQMQAFQGGMRRDQKNKFGKSRPQGLVHDHHGSMSNGIKQPIPANARRPADRLLTEQLFVDQSGRQHVNTNHEGTLAARQSAQDAHHSFNEAYHRHEHFRPGRNTGHDDSLAVRPSIQGVRQNEAYHRHEHFLPEAPRFHFPDMENGRHSSDSGLLVSQGNFRLDHGPVTGYPPPLFPRPQTQAAMRAAAAELEAAVPQSFLSAEPANHRGGRKRSGNTRDPRDQDAGDTMYAQLLDELNIKSRQRGHAVLEGDIMSRDYFLQQRHGISAHHLQVQPPTPQPREKTELEKRSANLNVPVVSEYSRHPSPVQTDGSFRTTSTISEPPLTEYKADWQNRLKTPVDRELQTGFTHHPERQGGARQLNMPLGFPREATRHEIIGRQVSDPPNTTSGFPTGRRMSISQPNSPRRAKSSLARMVDQLPKTRVESPAKRVAALNRNLPALSTGAAKEGKVRNRTPEWLVGGTQA